MGPLERVKKAEYAWIARLKKDREEEAKSKKKKKKRTKKAKDVKKREDDEKPRKVAHITPITVAAGTQNGESLPRSTRLKSTCRGK